VSTPRGDAAPSIPVVHPDVRSDRQAHLGPRPRPIGRPIRSSFRIPRRQRRLVRPPRARRALPLGGPRLRSGPQL